MISKTKIKFRAERKVKPELRETISLASKNSEWLELAKVLSGSTKEQAKVNLKEIDAQTSAGDTVVIPGKVLSLGDLSKKVRIVSLGISAQAREKLSETKSEFVFIEEEIKKNPKAEGIKVIR